MPIKPSDSMPWDEVETELLASLPDDEPSDVWGYSDLLPRAPKPAQPGEAVTPSSRRAG